MVVLSFMLRISFCCVSIGCIIGGIASFVLASQKTFTHEVEEYRRAVDAWPAARQYFEAISRVALRAVVTPAAQLGLSGAGGGGRPATEVELQALRTPDPLRGTEEGALLPTYESILFRAGLPSSRRRRLSGPPKLDFPALPPSVAGPVPAGFLPDADLTELQAVSLTERWGSTASFELHVGDAVLALEDMPLARAVAHYEPDGVYDHCRDMGGLHASGGKCWMNERLTHLCVQVAFEGGSWRLAHRAAGENRSYGCTYKAGKWEAAEYTVVPVVRGQDGRWQELQNSTVHFDDFSVEVRSVADPYFVALELTRGSLNFGWTEAEEDVLGIVLLVLGIVFGARPMHLLYKSIRGERRKAREQW